MPRAHVGFDVGSSASCVAVCSNGVAEVLMNEHGKRETPTVVSHGKKRSVGAHGPSSSVNITDVKQLLGKQYSHPLLKEECRRFRGETDVCEGESGRVAIQIASCGSSISKLAPEQVTASVLKHLKQLAETVNECSVEGAVLAVPVYFRECERSAMLAAAYVAGVRNVHLMHDLTAAALNWATSNSRQLGIHPTRVAFVDVGYTSTQV
jgi:molecular chaperone DnaK (HSP70)